MFGMSMGEILIIAIIAILFLGPDKLPDAMVKIAKFFKTFKSSINDVKNSFEQEMKIQELKEEALEYKKKLDDAATSARKVITFDELEEIKKSTQGVNDSLKEIEQTIASPMNSDRTMQVSIDNTPITPTTTLNESLAETKKEVNA
ncbi:MAG: Sec-independent protein translocase protein TatB [Sulfurospirillaceae bacterium]|jgi:sec-independent protein translocase protein TatB|nr:Sec-independent protein translocase protein TatB [Sulfurospirillaceae bacterium]MDD2825780.1 Sec-independent protein translocase protein TatB [Sulfurospirillaceae bacterium]